MRPEEVNLKWQVFTASRPLNHYVPGLQWCRRISSVFRCSPSGVCPSPRWLEKEVSMGAISSSPLQLSSFLFHSQPSRERLVVFLSLVCRLSWERLHVRFAVRPSFSSSRAGLRTFFADFWGILWDLASGVLPGNSPPLRSVSVSWTF